ncbi:MAG TPA: PIN domain-containing protein [Thermoanaerobaculia bacterium]|nr:PIN domain-containing protein [Thermoanaerobaculia bacterium]
MAESSSPFVLDSSAILALIEDEEGAERVEQVIRSSAIILPAVVLMEVFYILRQERGEAEAYRLYAHARELANEIVWRLDEPTLLLAGRFKADHKVSLADAWIAATAVQRGATLLHKDPEFEVLEAEVRMEALPYK